MSALQKFFHSVGHSINGLRHVAATEANMRWHLLATVAVVVCGSFFRISMIEWSLVIGCIGAVLALECINTSIERLADRVTTDHDPLIGQSKDVAAAAVLIMSLAAAIIGLIVFLPKVWAMFNS